MTSNVYPPPPSKAKKVKKKKKADPFWPIVIILSILAFTGSFWFFYMLTSKINTRNFPTTDTPKLMLTPSPDVALEGSTVQVGGNRGETTGVASPAASVSALATRSPAAVASAAATRAPVSTPVPTAVPTVAATPVATAVPTAVPAQTASNFKVQVGSYGSRDEAQQIATQLSGKGYSPIVVEESGRFRVQLGVYVNQEGALALAQEVTQQGYEVVVRKGTP